MLKINFETAKLNNNYKNYNQCNFKKNCGRLSPLKCDTVSFSGLKKSKFSGIDLLIVNKFKAPIEQFNTNKDFQNWCEKKIKKIVIKDYKGRHNETINQRKIALEEWFNYIQYGNNNFNNATSLLILDGITKELDYNNDNLPPALNKKVLKKTINDIQNNINENLKYDVNFLKLYQYNLQNEIFNKKDDLCDIKTGWIKIPSQKNDPKNFTKNVDKLKLLSPSKWCTKGYSAEPYLKKGDFHIYVEVGKAKLGIRFIDDKIEEIQGELNNSTIPFIYFDIVKEHIEGKELSSKAKWEVESGQKIKNKIDNIKQKLQNGAQNALPEEIFNAVGIEVEKDKDGLLIISEYRQPFMDYTYKELGVDENKLIEKVKEIKGVAYFNNSQITELINLQKIGNNVNFDSSKITSLGKLETIGGNAYFCGSKITDLGRLKSIGGDADFKYSQVKDLGDLKSIDGNADFSSSAIKSLKDLEKIGCSANFEFSIVEDLGNLQSIGDNAIFVFSEIEDLKNLQSIGGTAIFYNSKVKNLGKLESIGGDIDFESSQIENLSNLEYIGGNAFFCNSNIKNIGKLKTIGKKCRIEENQTELIKQLKEKGISYEKQ